jgi:predicted metal-binding protein
VGRGVLPPASAPSAELAASRDDRDGLLQRAQGGVVKLATLQPRAHLFVCANRRAEGDPLGAGCAARGDDVYAALKREVVARGLVRSVWVARTQCLGLCPQRGCAVALSPGGRYLVEVEPGDAATLLDALARVPG